MNPNKPFAPGPYRPRPGASQLSGTESARLAFERGDPGHGGISEVRDRTDNPVIEPEFPFRNLRSG